MEKNKKYKCMRCKYSWKARTKKPRICPRCKSKNWNKKKISDIVDLILK